VRKKLVASIALLLSIGMVLTSMAFAQGLPSQQSAIKQKLATGHKPKLGIRAKGLLKKDVNAGVLPLNNGWVNNTVEYEGQTYYSFKLINPSKVVLQLYAPYRGPSMNLSKTTSDSYTAYTSPAKKYPATSSITLYLDPGDYTVDIMDDDENGSERDKPFKVRAAAVPVQGLTSPGDHTSIGKAVNLALGQKYIGLAGAQASNSGEIHKFTLNEDARVNFKYVNTYRKTNQYLYRQEDFQSDDFDMFGDALYELRIDDNKTLKKAASYAKDIDLKAGSYYVVVGMTRYEEDDEGEPASYNDRDFLPCNNNGPYQLTVSLKGKATPPMVMTGDNTVTQGFRTELGVSMYPFIFDVPKDIVYTSSKPAYASIVKEDGEYYVYGRSAGKKVWISATSASANASVRYQVTVCANTISYSRPYYDPEEYGLYASVKRMYFKGNYLFVDMYIYNYSKYTLKWSSKYWLEGGLYESGNEDCIDYSYVNFKPSGGKIGAKKYAVCTFKYSIVDPDGERDNLNTYDLRLGDLDADLDFYDDSEDDDDYDDYGLAMRGLTPNAQVRRPNIKVIGKMKRVGKRMIPTGRHMVQAADARPEVGYPR
jgi:hypothetical protein